MTRPLLASPFLFYILILPISLVSANEREATSASAIVLAKGFQAELLHSAQPTEGSWISMTFESPTSLILGGDLSGLYRLKLGAPPEETTFELLAGTETLSHCRGVLYAFDSLYACATDGQGIYRLQDHDQDGQYEEITLICPLVYNSRYGHGANQLIAGTDGHIYVSIGNDVEFPENVTQNLYRHHANDWLLPDPRNGEDDSRVGYILKLSPDGQSRTVIAGGLRNQVDIAFNEAGELFTWDADMEWDVGMPWYRPTRINHIVPGGEYGWRWGTGKWPAWFPDSLPSNCDTGLGSPTGILFGNQSCWPGKYAQAMYAADWQNGRLLCIDFQEQGASYVGTASVFAEGNPLNIADMNFGPDGNLYFITGGRGSQSGLYRISLLEPEAGIPDSASLPRTESAAEARKRRHQLERLQIEVNPDELPFIFQQLDSDDAWIRHAARIALENQPVALWRKQLATAPDSTGRRAGLMALSRVGEQVDQKIVLEGIKEFDFTTGSSEDLVQALRLLQLTLIRQGNIDVPDRDLLGRRLLRMPVTADFQVNWLRAELLIAMNAKGAVPEVIRLLQVARSQEEQLQYVKTLMRARDGWTLETRRVLLDWLITHKRLPGGRLLEANLLGFREDFEASLNADERRLFEQELVTLREAPGEFSDLTAFAKRSFVNQWEVDDLVLQLEQFNEVPIDYEVGGKLAAEALCLRCHQSENRGGHIGPDLTTVGKRMDIRTLLEAIIEPSKFIDPKYNNVTFVMENGQVLSGRTTMVTGTSIGLETDPLTGQSVGLSRSEIESSHISLISPMPQGLLNSFSVEEIHQLIGYLRRELGPVSHSP